MPDALQLLRQDHQEVKDLFKRFESTEERREKQEIAEKAIVELVVHSMIEEEIFYPAVRQELEGQGEDTEIMFEAEEEHHVVDLLIEELTSGKVAEDSFDAKFKVMAENVKHHIQEEESMMLPKAAELGSDRLNKLGEEMYERKMELMEEFSSGPRRTARRGTSRAGGASRNGRTSTRRRTTRTTARRGVSRSRTTTRTGGTRGRSTSRRTTTATSRRTSTGRGSTRARSTTTKSRATTRSRGGRASTARSARSRSR
jgi:hemerythrin-like domain-containing protein